MRAGKENSRLFKFSGPHSRIRPRKIDQSQRAYLVRDKLGILRNFKYFLTTIRPYLTSLSSQNSSYL